VDHFSSWAEPSSSGLVAVVNNQNIDVNVGGVVVGVKGLVVGAGRGSGNSGLAAVG
jgi:hypothetical protein